MEVTTLLPDMRLQLTTPRELMLFMTGGLCRVPAACRCKAVACDSRLLTCSVAGPAPAGRRAAGTH